MSSTNASLANNVGVGDEDEGGGSMPPTPTPEPSSWSSQSSPVATDAPDAGGRRESEDEDEDEAAPTTAAAMAMMVSSLAEELTSLGGFDVCHPFHTSWYNSLLADEGLLGDGEGGTLVPLPDGNARSSSSSSSAASPSPSASPSAAGGANVATAACNAVLIGNTRRMWPKFIDWLLRVRTREERSDGCDDEDEAQASFDAQQLLSNDPLDAFATDIIETALSRHASRFRPGGNGGRAGVNAEETKVEVATTSAPREHGKNDETGTRLRDNDNACGGKKNYDIFWSHDTRPRRLVSMQRVAAAAGCCYFDRDFTMLSVHPTYGPWVAFRAVVVFFGVDDVDVDVMSEEGGGTALLRSVSRPSPRRPPPPPPPPLVECLLTEEERGAAAKISLESPALSGTDSGREDLCEKLHGAGGGGNKSDGVPLLEDVHVALIARRDCIALGREEYRYSEGQILYHYMKDRGVLLKEMMSSSG